MSTEGVCGALYGGGAQRRRTRTREEGYVGWRQPEEVACGVGEGGERRMTARWMKRSMPARSGRGRGRLAAALGLLGGGGVGRGEAARFPGSSLLFLA
jgi:hypothetical protein